MDIHNLVLRRQDSIHSERKREIKHIRKASYFTKVQKKQEGLLSEDDNISSLNYVDVPTVGGFDQFLDPVAGGDLLHSSLSDTEGKLLFDDDFMLDTTQDLPIRKPQSAYVIFGKMVSILYFNIIMRMIEKGPNHALKPRD